MQLKKEDRDAVRREETVENFLADESSSDENIDYNMVFEGMFSYHLLFYNIYVSILVVLLVTSFLCQQTFSSYCYEMLCMLYCHVILVWRLPIVF